MPAFNISWTEAGQNMSSQIGPFANADVAEKWFTTAYKNARDVKIVPIDAPPAPVPPALSEESLKNAGDPVHEVTPTEEAK